MGLVSIYNYYNLFSMKLHGKRYEMKRTTAFCIFLENLYIAIYQYLNTEI
jgi:hypothetical protein